MFPFSPLSTDCPQFAIPWSTDAVSVRNGSSDAGSGHTEHYHKNQRNFAGQQHRAKGTKLLYDNIIVYVAFSVTYIFIYN